MKMNRTVNILVECPSLIPSVRLGVLEPLKPLESQGKCIVRFLETIHITKKDIAWCDIFICVRGFEYVSMKAAKAAKLAGRFVIYFLDDDLLNIPEGVGSKDYFSDQDQKSALINIIGFSDVIWCVNSLIGKKYSVFGNGRWVLERVPVTLFPIQSSKDGVINILYSGSTDHTSVIQEYISPVVQKLCEEFREMITFTFIGADPGLHGYHNVRYIKFFDNYEDYNHFISKSRFHIGLAPIRNTEFYQCKYYNKFIEYGKIGAVGLYTDCLPYRLVIRNNQNGFLCQNTFESWYTTLKRVINDSDLRKQCTNAAYNDLLNNFSYDRVGTQLLEDIPELEFFYAPCINSTKIQLKNMFFLFYAKRASFLWRRYGVLAIPITCLKAIKKIKKIFFH